MSHLGTRVAPQTPPISTWGSTRFRVPTCDLPVQDFERDPKRGAPPIFSDEERKRVWSLYSAGWSMEKIKEGFERMWRLQRRPMTTEQRTRCERLRSEQAFLVECGKPSLRLDAAVASPAATLDVSTRRLARTCEGAPRVPSIGRRLMTRQEHPWAEFPVNVAVPPCPPDCRLLS